MAIVNRPPSDVLALSRSCLSCLLSHFTSSLLSSHFAHRLLMSHQDPNAGGTGGSEAPYDAANAPYDTADIPYDTDPVDDAPENAPNEDFIDVNDVGEEIHDDGTNMSEEEDDDHIEIDLSNNSWAYFDQHKDSIFTVFGHPSLPMVLTGGGDNMGYLWTTHSQPPRFVGAVEGHLESVVTGGFSADGKFLVTGDMNGLIQVHKANKSGQRWVKFSELQEVEEVLWIRVHPKFPCFAFGGTDGSVWCYQIDDDSKTVVQLMSGFLHTMECNTGIFIDSGDDNDLRLVTAAEDGTVVCWNGYTGTTHYKLLPHDEFKGVESPWVSLAALNNLVALGARDGYLAILNCQTGKVVHAVKTIEDVDDVAELSIEAISWCNAPGVNLLALGLVSGDVLLFDTLQWRVRNTVKLDDTVTKLQFIGNTANLVGSCMDGKIYVWDARTFSEVFVGVGHNMGVLDFDIVGGKLVTAGDEGVSLVFDPEGGEK